jgi:hypothetical protein
LCPIRAPAQLLDTPANAGIRAAPGRRRRRAACYPSARTLAAGDQNGRVYPWNIFKGST